MPTPRSLSVATFLVLLAVASPAFAAYGVPTPAPFPVTPPRSPAKTTDGASR